ncbi:MAG: response regulator transcription factor [Anaerolineae bacterium]
MRLLLVDDHEIVRAGLRSLLGGHAELEVVGEAAGGEEAVALATELQPDVVLMDVSMPKMDGAEATRQIKKRTPDVNILALTIHEEEAYFFEMLNAGACGYIPKRASPQILLTAIRVAARGEVFLHPAVAGTLVQDYLRRARTGKEQLVYNGLTPRQREVLTLIAEGLSNQEIADRLEISVRTVERHRENILKRLNLHSRVDLVKYAIRKGLIQLEEERPRGHG